MGLKEVGTLQQQPKRTLFKSKKPKTVKPKPEWRIQAEIVSFLHKLQDQGWDFEFAGDMNAGKRNASRAKLTGLKAGETDMRFYFPFAIFKMIELKNKNGKVSKDQETRHERLRALGFEVVIVKAVDERDGVSQVGQLMVRWMGQVAKRAALNGSFLKVLGTPNEIRKENEDAFRKLAA